MDKDEYPFQSKGYRSNSFFEKCLLLNIRTMLEINPNANVAKPASIPTIAENNGNSALSTTNPIKTKTIETPNAIPNHIIIDSNIFQKIFIYPS